MMSDRDPFYVGYLPLPAAIKRFVVPWLLGNLVLAIGLAAVLASSHREPGDGVWETGSVVALEGELIVDPYPMIRSEGKTYILVEQGKMGVLPRIQRQGIPGGDGLANRVHVVATGFLIEREGRTVLELDSAIDEPLKHVYSFTFSGGSVFGSEDLGTHTLVGEIVDPKCYLGVMQPGDGKTHKACATLCISGGIPPVLVVRNDAGQEAAYLLTDSQGQPFPESHYEYIADPIEVTGRVLRDGDLLILRADLASIRRLD